MADAKKDDKVAVASIEIGAIVGVIALVAAWPSIMEYMQTVFVGFGGPAAWTTAHGYYETFTSIAYPVARGILSAIVTVAFPVSLFFIIGIVYCVEQIKFIRKKEEEKYGVHVVPAYETGVKANKGNAVLAERWATVQKHILSDNSNDWRQAILEADIMLEDVLTSLGYRGEGIGEKLKRVEKGDMATLDQAWEAHKIRNQVAHEGSSFNLSQFQAQRVINQYKEVFEEFYYI
jgi:hypothetical protein